MKTKAALFVPALLLGIAWAGMSAIVTGAEPPPSSKPPLSTLFDKEVVAAFQSLPVQEGGRIKPLDTYARFLLLRIHGKQSISIEHPEIEGSDHKRKLNAVEWLLMSWFRPDIARDVPLFVVDNSQSVGEIGVDPKSLRDRYSYNEIVKGRDELQKRAEQYSAIEAGERTAVQRNIVDLARNFFDFDAVSDYFVAGRTDWRQEVGQWLPKEVGDGLPKDRPVSVWDLSEKLGAFIREKGPMALGDEARNKLLTALIDKSVRPGMTLAFIPPDDPANEVWLKLGDVVTNLMRDGKVAESELRLAREQSALLAASASAESFRSAVKTFVEDARKRAEARGELTHVDREVTYHQRDYFTNALVYYLLGFLIAILGLVAPRTGFAKWSARIATVSLIAAVAYNVWGIVDRCIINSRPPVATLYETLIFIAAVCAIVGLFVEAVLRNGIGAMTCGFLGALGMFVSNLFMELDKADTMPTLEAVLITNFWLATHVTAINIGYAGSMLASLVAMAYLVFRTFKRGHEGEVIRRLLTRIVYGMVCFGLLFSLVGTVLGGIWANDSWGRFWGWDPKENGALMIVLMGLIILHARLGAYVHQLGIHVLSIVLGAITLFSWFGVNQLSIGLHTYGFTAGIWVALWSSWTVQGLFLLLAGFHWWHDRRARSRATAAPEGIPSATAG